jgi:glycolate oxidase FAD binding subunit
MIGNTKDMSSDLLGRVRDALNMGNPLAVMGGNTKRFLGRSVAAAQVLTPLLVGEHRGIVHYDPTELVLTARAGTPLSDIEAVLAERGQMLACEPPHFGPQATFGGMVAAGISGPRRPWSGAVRDLVLGCRLIDGRARHLRFGGEVMKNVAGYDVSRLMAGSFGCLGVLTEISMKVMPKPGHRRTLRIDVDAAQALRHMDDWAREPAPISAAYHDGTALFVRLEGGSGSVQAWSHKIGGGDADETIWDDLREHRLPFFDDTGPLWRLSVPRATPPIELAGAVLIDWAGCQRWLRTEADGATIRRIVQGVGGHAIAYRGQTDEPFHPLSAPLLALLQRLKSQFDPQGLFNPGRLYGSL